MGIEVLDCARGGQQLSRLREMEYRECACLPVTFDDENGCSMLDSSAGLWHDPRRGCRVTNAMEDGRWRLAMAVSKRVRTFRRYLTARTPVAPSLAPGRDGPWQTPPCPPTLPSQAPQWRGMSRSRHFFALIQQLSLFCKRKGADLDTRELHQISL